MQIKICKKFHLVQKNTPSINVNGNFLEFTIFSYVITG